LSPTFICKEVMATPLRTVIRLNHEYMDIIQEPVDHVLAHPLEENILVWYNHFGFHSFIMLNIIQVNHTFLTSFSLYFHRLKLKSFQIQFET